MSEQEKDRQDPGWHWEKALVDDYCDYRWRQLLEPLCDTFRKWKDGELGYEDVDQAIEKAYKEKCWICNLVAQRKDRAAGLIQWWDREWFDAWVKEHRLPSEISSSVAEEFVNS